jgi:hypothetical protein
MLLSCCETYNDEKFESNINPFNPGSGQSGTESKNSLAAISKKLPYKDVDMSSLRMVSFS